MKLLLLISSKLKGICSTCFNSLSACFTAVDRPDPCVPSTILQDDGLSLMLFLTVFLFSIEAVVILLSRSCCSLPSVINPCFASPRLIASTSGGNCPSECGTATCWRAVTNSLRIMFGHLYGFTLRPTDFHSGLRDLGSANLRRKEKDRRLTT